MAADDLLFGTGGLRSQAAGGASPRAGESVHDRAAGMDAGPAERTSGDLQAPADSDAIKIAEARAAWLQGNWETLTAITPEDISRHPDRGELAALAACAHQFAGGMELSELLVRRALAWGYDRRKMARLLVAGLHNTLGRISASRNDDAGVSRHFGLAVEADSAGDQSAGAARAVRELARLGLLPGAVQAVEGSIAVAGQQAWTRGDTRLAQIKSEIGLLKHELSLALQRRQLYSRAPDGAGQDLQSLSVAQLQQDLWVLEKTGYKHGGFFVEFGATDGVLLSNTLLLEKQFDWTGLLAEPNPAFHEALKRNRTATISHACIGGLSGEKVEFIFAEAFGGMARHIEADQHAARRTAYRRQESNVTILPTVSLHDFLKSHGAPRRIDYISVDTEGSEWEILSHFPFAEWDIQLWTIEHNFSTDRARMQHLMKSHGYQCVEAKWDDWYFR